VAADGVTTARVLEKLKVKPKDFFNKSNWAMAKEIGEEMGLATSTVEYHINKLKPEIEKLKKQQKDQEKELVKEEKQGDEEDDEDWKYRPMLKGAFSTRCDYDGNKIEGTLE